MVQVPIATTFPNRDLLRDAQRLQMLTIAWMTGEAAVALTAAWRARNPALLGSQSEPVRTERIAARVAGVLLFIVAAFIVTASGLTLLGYGEPRQSYAGIALLMLAAIGMPWLASRKRKLATKLSSPSLKADATESSLCGYLSWIALAGLLANALFQKSWADPVAALVLVPFVLKEGWEAMSAARPGCHCCPDLPQAVRE
jgi:Co/Zn/Cd efflux system component